MDVAVLAGDQQQADLADSTATECVPGLRSNKPIGKIEAARRSWCRAALHSAQEQTHIVAVGIQISDITRVEVQFDSDYLISLSKALIRGELDCSLKCGVVWEFYGLAQH